MGFLDRFKNNKPQKNRRDSWYQTPCRDFAYNFVMRYESFFDIIDSGYNENKDILFGEMVDIVSVWMERCPEDANSIFAAIILIGNNPECENMNVTTNQMILDQTYSLACSVIPAIVNERKNWFYQHAIYTMMDTYFFKEYVEKMPEIKKMWFVENKSVFFTNLRDIALKYQK